MADVMNPTTKGQKSVSKRCDCSNKSLAARTEAPNKTGMDMRKEKRALSALERPKNMPAAIVEPERLTPGNKAQVCARPIMRAILKVMPTVGDTFLPIHSAAKSKSAVPIKKYRVALASEKKLSRWSLKSNPITTAGMVAITI